MPAAWLKEAVTQAQQDSGVYSAGQTLWNASVPGINIFLYMHQLMTIIVYLHCSCDIGCVVLDTVSKSAGTVNGNCFLGPFLKTKYRTYYQCSHMCSRAVAKSTTNVSCCVKQMNTHVIKIPQQGYWAWHRQIVITKKSLSSRWWWMQRTLLFTLNFNVTHWQLILMLVKNSVKLFIVMMIYSSINFVVSVNSY